MAIGIFLYRFTIRLAITHNAAEYQCRLKNKVAGHKVSDDDITEYKKYMAVIIDDMYIDKDG